jgi:hypothetical protein
MNNAEYFACLRCHLADRQRSPAHTRELIALLRGQPSGFSPVEVAALRVLLRELEECDQAPGRAPGLGTI